MVLAAPATPVAAHGGDPTLVPVVRRIEPALPAEVVVQVRTTVSEQMIIANPTSTPLLVLDPDDVPFLRISSAGAEGNVTDPFFHRTLNPPGVPLRAPDSAQHGAAPRWVTLTDEANWGWFEPRLHPFEPGTEPGIETDVELTKWQIGLRYGSHPVRVDGALDRRSVTGVFAATLAQRSDDLQVSVAQGPVPALFLIAPPGRRVEIEGRDGRPFLRLNSTGVYANPASSGFRENPDFAATTPGPNGWVRVGEPGRVRWLDARLRYSADRPPAVIERAKGTSELSRWTIPLTIDAASAPLHGTITWIPAGTVARSGGGSSWALWVIPGGIATLVGALFLAVRRRRRHEA